MRRIELSFPALEPATAAWLLDLCGQLQHAILGAYGNSARPAGPRLPPSSASMVHS